MTDKGINKNIPVFFQKLNEYAVNDLRFTSIRIWILHTGLNYNNSIFEKEKVEKNLHTLANTPVLAFIEDNSEGEKDFSDHRMVLERKDDGELGLKYLGQAIGVIPESHNAHWEFRVGDDGVEREYLVCDALIWNKWDDPVDIFNREQKTWQSMELSDKYTGEWNKDGHFVFDSFEFNGACLLSNIDTLPAMNNSTAELVYTRSTTEKVFTDIKNKLEMFNKAFSEEVSEEGGKEMSEEAKENFEQVEEVTEETVEVLEETIEDTDSVEEVVTEDTEVAEESDEVEEINYQEKFEELEKELNTLKDKYSTLEEEAISLREFKQNKLTEERKSAETELFESFSSELTEDEMKELMETSADFSLEDLESKLYALVGKKKATFSKQVKREKKAVKIEIEEKEEKTSPYGNVFEKYLGK